MFEIKVKIDVTDNLLNAVKMLTKDSGLSTTPADIPEVEAPKVETKEVVKKTTTKQKIAAKKEDPKKEPKADKAEETVKDTEPDKEDKSAESNSIPTKEDVRRVGVLAIRADKQAVAEMLEKDFPGCSRLSEIAEDDRARAVELLRQIAES